MEESSILPSFVLFLSVKNLNKSLICKPNSHTQGKALSKPRNKAYLKIQWTMESVSLMNFTWHLKDMWIQKKLLFFNHILCESKKFGCVVFRARTAFFCVGDGWCYCTTNRAGTQFMTKALKHYRKPKKLIMLVLETNLSLHPISDNFCHKASEALCHNKHRLKHPSGMKARSAKVVADIHTALLDI